MIPTIEIHPNIKMKLLNIINLSLTLFVSSFLCTIKTIYEKIHLSFITTYSY